MRCDLNGAGCYDIVGSTGSMYVLQNGDVFNQVKVRVTATNNAGSTTADSNLSTEIDPLG